MPKTQSRSQSSTGRQEPPNTGINFKIGDRAIIKSTHPIFPSVSCTISALPSPDAAIVELEDEARERILLKYLEPLSTLEQADEFGADKFDSTVQISQNNSIEQPSGNHFDISNEELSFDEERERHRLELKVERAFYEAGAALRDLRDKRLYRSTHKTFEDYCIERFGFSRRHPYRLIDAASVVDNLCPNGTQNSLETSRIQILPTSERQVRDLVNLEPQQQREIWNSAVAIADGKVPSSRIVKGIVERLLEKPLYKASDFCFVGDVFTLTKLEGEERKYNGYPCVAIELKHFTINVDVYECTLAVKPENLKKIDSPDINRQLPVTLKRIKQLRNLGQVDRGKEAVLAHLGRQIYLTDFEEKLLTFMEKEHGIESN